MSQSGRFLNLKNFKFSERITTIARRAVQIISFLFINYMIFEFIFQADLSALEGFVKILPILNSARNPLSEGAGTTEYIFYAISQGIFPLLIIAGFMLVILFTSRFFCGWICPIGTIQDAVSYIPVENKTMKLSTHKQLLKLKYLIAIVLIVLIVPLGISRTTDIGFYREFKEGLGAFSDKPVGFFSLSEYIFVFFPNLIVEMFDTGGIQPLFADFGTFFIFAFYIGIILISVWYPRFYCRYMCPFGAFAAVVGDYSLLKLSRSPVKCVGRAECGICERECPKQIRILDEPFEFFTGQGECNLCLKCKERCPYTAITVRFG
ncbi:MAG: putative electron transport protein YccM [Promethearchaeota archaeon]|nr:MAG: putative electron transport protein YccM [Candidatus Lokiarchaeota archaeon]